MLTVHHLNDSRSQRILWLLEELGLPYQIVRYEREPHGTPPLMLAPASLKAISPLGKAPVVVEEDGQVLLESGAIIEILLRRYGKGRLAPAADSRAYDQYIQWLHYAEGSAMLPLMLKVYLGRLKSAAEPMQPRVDSEIDNHLGYVEASLQGKDYLLGHELSGADIQMSFVGEVAQTIGKLSSFPAIGTWVKRFQARPAYQKALEQGGAYVFAKP